MRPPRDLTSFEDQRYQVIQYLNGSKSYPDTKESLVRYSDMVWHYFRIKLSTKDAKKESLIEDMQKELVILRDLATKLEVQEVKLKDESHEFEHDFGLKLSEFYQIHVPEISGYQCKVTHVEHLEPSPDLILLLKEQKRTQGDQTKEQMGKVDTERMELRCRALEQELLNLEPKMSQIESDKFEFSRLCTEVEHDIGCLEMSISNLKLSMELACGKSPSSKREREGNTECSTSEQKKQRCDKCGKY